MQPAFYFLIAKLPGWLKSGQFCYEKMKELFESVTGNGICNQRRSGDHSDE